MKFETKEITLIGLVAALTVAVGSVFYFVGHLFPVPGYKFVVFAPFLGFMIYIPMRKIGKIGVVTAINLIFGLIMSTISFVMTVAIISAGILAELVAWILFRKYDTPRKTMLAAGLYPVAAVLCASYASFALAGNLMYQLVGGGTFILLLSVIVYIMGVLGAYFGDRFVYQRIFPSKTKESERI